MHPARRIHRFVACQRTRRFTTASPASKGFEPLRILFCGSDAFSICSLRALDAFKRESNSRIEQIDVLCRPDKRVGRGLKKIQSVPIKAVSQELGLGLHQIDTFKDWTPPSAFNLIITASFGLLVPARILTSAQYGGLNVHPSLLPDFRGASPIQHAIMHRVSTTGVSVQTMHPTKFDHGIVLAQQAVDLTNGDDGEPWTTPALIERLGPIGGRLLVDSIREALFVEPVTPIEAKTGSLRKAPKLTPADREVQWDSWTAEDILARDRAVGKLWDRTSFAQCDTKKVVKRITFEGPWRTSKPNSGIDASPGTPVLTAGTGLAWTTADGVVVSPSSATIEGEGRDQGLKTLQHKLAVKYGSPNQ